MSAVEQAQPPQQGEYQRCPVCNGRGWLPHGFYITSPSFTSVSTEDERCRTCRGMGIIERP